MATIITEVFVKTAEAYTPLMGVPDFPYLVCPHPITSVTPADLLERGEFLAPGARSLLLEGRP